MEEEKTLEAQLDDLNTKYSTSISIDDLQLARSECIKLAQSARGGYVKVDLERALVRSFRNEYPLDVSHLRKCINIEMARKVGF